MSHPDPLVGSMLGRFSLQRQVGKGGMGVVYAAEDTELKRLVAVKVLPAEFASEEKVIKRFIREAQSSAKLNHANIVQVYGAGQDSGRHYIAMEFVQGEPLSEVIKREKRLETRKALDIFIQLLSALAEAHRRGVVHRDIKPQNIMLTPDGKVKLMDFGIARLLMDATNLTTGNATVGTPHYMAPEQWQGSKVDARADIYAVGATLYEMLTGRTPFSGDTPLVLMRQVLMEIPEPMSRVDPRISPVLSRLVSKMLAKKPEDRFHTVDIARQQFDAYMGKGGQVTVDDPTASRAKVIDPFKDLPPQEVAEEKAASPPRNAQPKAQPASKSVPAPIAELNVRFLAWALLIAFTTLSVAYFVFTEYIRPTPEIASDLFPANQFVWIRPGSFVMGSPPNETGRAQDEGPVTVTLTKGFWMSKYEVTQAQFQAVMGYNPAAFQSPQHPVETVTWHEAVDFCQRLSRAEGRTFRLPTEAQWEYACRAGSDTVFCYGNTTRELSSYAWYNANSQNATHPVGEKRANAWGLHDMHGNVWEWCSDWVGLYPGGSITDPVGPSSGTLKVGRGGSFVVDVLKCRSADRSASAPKGGGADLGFRVCMEAEES